MMREIETLRDRVHDHIVPLLSSWNHIFMESDYQVDNLNLLFPYAQMDLERWLNLREPPEPWQSDDLIPLKDYIYGSVMSLCDAVAYLHSAIEGRITSHHDLKPANILLFGKTWKIADFGRTHLLRLSVGSDTAGPLGSFMYHPPEYYDASGGRANVRHGRAFDIWALGCIALEFATIASHGWKSQALRRFRADRRRNQQTSKRLACRSTDDDDSYHNNMNVVWDWIQIIRKTDGSHYLTSVLEIAGTMLSEEPNERPLSWEAYLDFYELLNPHATNSDKDVKIRENIQEPTPWRLKGDHNPLQRAAAKGDRLRVQCLLKAGWAEHPVDISIINGMDKDDIVKMLKLAPSVKGIKWRRASRKLLEGSRTPTRGGRVTKRYESEDIRKSRKALKAFDRLNKVSTDSMTFGAREIDEIGLAQDRRGMTELHRMCQNRDYINIRHLLERATPASLAKLLTCQDKRGRIPLHYAASNGEADLIKLLLYSFGLNPIVLLEWQDIEGRTALHIAAQTGNFGVIGPLLQKYARHARPQEYLLLQDKWSFTALDLAVMSGQQGTEYELRRYSSVVGMIPTSPYEIRRFE